jgi:cellulose synthase/poly-beta-1,6-N-acetylglucosamine synthase-like glycosyltransferase
MMLFCICAGLILYTYAIYPLLVVTLARFRREPVPPAADAPIKPTVSLLIVARNEEAVIERRLLNALLVDYPSDRLEIVVASDASTDETAELVRRYADRGVRLLEFDIRRGKAGVLNRSIPQLTGQIVLLSDANTDLDPIAVRKLVRWFDDPNIGVVCGRLVLTDPQTGQNADGLYWRYETMLKRSEARLDALLGANGAIYAIRKSAYVPLPDRMIVEDFVIPLLSRLRNGSAIRYEADAVAREATAADVREEFRRRVRIGIGNFQALGLLRPLLHPRHGLLAFAFVSHKVLRWLCPFFMLGLLMANLALLNRPFFQVALAAQLGGYVVAAATLFVPTRTRLPGIVRLIAMFVSMNAALLVGFFRWLIGREHSGWQPTRRETDSSVGATRTSTL